MIDTSLPIPLLLLQSFLSQALGYFAGVGAVFLVVWRWGRAP